MVGEWRVEPSLDRVSRRGETRPLRRQVMELLVYLADRPGDVVSTDELLTDLWDGRVVTESSVYNCVRELRLAFADDEDADSVIETIPRRGYRLVAPVNPLKDATSSPPSSRRRVLVGVLLGAVAVCALVVLLARGPSEREDIRAIAILPLDNHSPNGDSDEYFVDAMTEALIARLGQNRELRIISRTSVMQLKDSDMTIPEIARLLEVDAVIEGSVLTAEGQARITLQLIDADTDAHLWANTYTSDLNDVIRLQDEVAAATASELQVRLFPTNADEVVPRGEVPSTDAYRAYMRGRYLFNQFGAENFRKAIDHYSDAIGIDPSFALAFASRAEVCMQPLVIMSGMRSLEECELDARQATALDDNLAEAHAILGFVHLINWRLADAETAFERAIGLNPNSVTARQWYAETLRSTYRFAEALTELETAEKLDPLNLFVKTMVGWPLYNQGRYELALRQWDDVIEMNPGFMLAHYNRGLAFIQLRQPADVLAAADRVAELAGDDAMESRLLRASAYAISSEVERAQALIDSVEQQGGRFAAAWIASIYLMLGREDQALTRLERGLADRSPDMLTITEPKFDSVRDHPRFRAVSRAIGLPDPS